MELDDVFRTHQSAIYAYLLRMLGDPSEAEELTQETFYRACVSALRFRGDSSVRTWLFGIARRVFLERVRSRRRIVPVHELPDRPSDSGDASDRLALERAFQGLSLDDRELLMLVDVLGFRPAEAAVTLELDPGALRVRLHRARHRMREQLS